MKKIAGKAYGYGKRALAKVVEYKNAACSAFAAAAVAVTVFSQTTVMAAETAVTIPDMPIDWADIGEKAALIIGAVVAGVIGVGILMSLIRMGIKFLRSVLA